ncbi:DUF3078 domain-containing protein [Mucilaginibacter panaciglaebae]|uniref:DUF3078 family protein n=1 Tax=Mucilaginibacter panaciglaebae TaxID=502331 RepID=A0ABP7X5I2_9SPHI
MLKNISGYFFLGLLTVASLSASAQNTDSLKKDSVKIDTALLNKYHIDAPKNSLPVRTRTIQVKQELIPVTLLDYHVSYWRKWISLNIAFNQSSFSNNYVSGGANAIAVGGDFEYRSEYKRGTLDYVTDLHLWYAKSKNKGQGARKTNDRIYFDNKLATQLSKSWFFFGSLTFESQFDKGYNYNRNGSLTLISDFLAPGYLTESIGFECKPSPWFDLRIGTGTARQTFLVNDTLYKNLGGNNYGVPKGKKFHNDLAFQMVTTIDKYLDQRKTLHLTTRYALFIPYEKNIKFITHRVDAGLSAQVTRLVSCAVNGTFVYDRSVKPDPQASEGLSLGITYRFPY